MCPQRDSAQAHSSIAFRDGPLERKMINPIHPSTRILAGPDALGRRPRWVGSDVVSKSGSIIRARNDRFELRLAVLQWLRPVGGGGANTSQRVQCCT
jgi:hypothetical protein